MQILNTYDLIKNIKIALNEDTVQQLKMILNEEVDSN